MPGDHAKIIRVGSRKSQLALVQTGLAIDMLKHRNPSLHFEIVEISTVGDKILDVALSKIGDKSLFTKELENALLEGSVDLVVHSLKDVPTTMPPGLVLGCVFDRYSPDDVVLMSPAYRGYTLSDLPHGAVVGTSALRRVATLSRLYPHLRFASVRGNLNTRLRKLDQGSDEASATYTALILAKAGVERLGWSHRIDQVLSDSLHAVSQGALTCECRKDDDFILSMLADLHNECAALSSIAERSLLRHLDGGCSTPIGVRSVLTPSDGPPRLLQLQANVLSVDGRQYVAGSLRAELPQEMPCQSKMAGQQAEMTESSSCQEFLDPAATQEEFDLANDPSTEFLGIHVNPTCAIARLRMARAVSVGRQLAGNLLNSGAAQILDEIRANAQKTLPVNSRPLDRLCVVEKSQP